MYTTSRQYIARFALLAAALVFWASPARAQDSPLVINPMRTS